MDIQSVDGRLGKNSGKKGIDESHSLAWVALVTCDL